MLVKNLEKREQQLEDIKNNQNINYLNKSTSFENYNKDSSEFHLQILNLDKSDYPNKITMDAIVVDTNGKYLTGLAPPFLKGNFKELWTTLTDSCANNNNRISDLKVTEFRTVESPNYAIAFVLDHSPSVGEQKVKNIQSGVRELIKYFKKPDMVSILKFTKKTYPVIKLTEDKFSVLDNFKVNGMEGIDVWGTAYYDAVSFGVDQLETAPEDYEKIIIAFTDGEDTGSDIEKDKLITKLKTNNIKLFNIGYGYADVDIMEELSQKTNGKFYMTFTVKEFPYVLKDIYLKLTNFYRITYKPSECAGKHNVNAKLTLDNNTTLQDTISYKIRLLDNKELGDVVFMNLQFETGKSTVKDNRSLQLLEEVATWMKENPGKRILIKGHTDDVGEKDFNLELSKKRTLFVKKILAAKDIDPNRIETKGFGESKPLVPNTNDENRRKNRRTEIEIIE